MQSNINILRFEEAKNINLFPWEKNRSKATMSEGATLTERAKKIQEKYYPHFSQSHVTKPTVPPRIGGGGGSKNQTQIKF